MLLDVPVASVTESAFIAALVARAPDALVTIPTGDAAAREAFGRLGPIESIDPLDAVGLGRIRQYLFVSSRHPLGQPLDEMELFSAPGEGRESVEIARRVLREARRGVPFDRMAIAVRAPGQYAALLEHALRRAGVPAYFDRGARRPHPAGRAFLALLACAVDNLSARRFAEYLSLGQVPDPTMTSADSESFPVSNDEVSRSVVPAPQP